MKAWLQSRCSNPLASTAALPIMHWLFCNRFEAIRSIAREPTTSRLDKLMRYVLWSQQVLQEKNITYTKMTNYVDVEFKGIDLIFQELSAA